MLLILVERNIEGYTHVAIKDQYNLIVDYK